MNKELGLRNNVLREISNISPKMYGEVLSGSRPLAKKFGITTKELNEIVDFLIHMRLLTRVTLDNQKEKFAWQITKEGFNYLEERDRQESGNIIQNGTLFLTLILALNGIAQIIIDIFERGFNKFIILFSIVYLIFILIVAFLIFKKSREID